MAGQPVFARYLNTSESTIEKWEAEAKRPSGMALKLLSVIKKYGLRRWSESDLHNWCDCLWSQMPYDDR
jgi:hypothetical protein